MMSFIFQINVTTDCVRFRLRQSAETVISDLFVLLMKSHFNVTIVTAVIKLNAG